MQYLSITVMFVPHRLQCTYVRRGVPSVTQNMFLFLLHNCWVSVSHLNSPFMNMKQISLEVFPQKKVVNVWLHICCEFTQWVLLGFCSVRVNSVISEVLRYKKKNLVILSNIVFACWSVSICCLCAYLLTNALFQGHLVCCIVFSTVRH